jgi:hypothetical protein
MSLTKVGCLIPGVAHVSVIGNIVSSFFESNAYYEINCSDLDDEVHYYQVVAGWLVHGGVGWFASIITGGFTGNPVTHWWVVIQTKKSRYYCAQMTRGSISLT